MCDGPGCGKKIIAECMCTEAVRLRGEIKDLVAEGLTRDEVLQFYMDKHGSQEPLAAPLNEGFNRLAWLFPYVLGAAALAGLVMWTRFGQEPERVTSPTEHRSDTALLEARLDDELRNLD
jgi:cytochrome c-type biogenesis protein CcmH/NrfF